MQSTESIASGEKAAAIPEHKKRRRNESFEHLLGRLSKQSVVKHFDAYADVPWDEPDYQIDPEDPRWIRSEDDPLGATHWYRSQPDGIQARIGLHSICGHMKIGLEFESVLKRGLLEFATTLPNGAPEFRYAYHEVIEEAQHSLMFQEFINRAGLPVGGLNDRMKKAARRVVSLGRTFPELFFMFVLGGEEPIDHVQREVLRKGTEIHPLAKRIMQIHITEEARHLCFAREYLKRTVPELSRWQMWKLRGATPVILGEMARLMMQPPTEIIRRYGIPEHVVDAAYTTNPAHRQATLDSIKRIRELCEELGVINKRSLAIWKRYGIWPDGRRLAS